MTRLAPQIAIVAEDARDPRVSAVAADFARAGKIWWTLPTPQFCGSPEAHR